MHLGFAGGQYGSNQQHPFCLGALPILPYDDPAAAWQGMERARLEVL